MKIWSKKQRQCLQQKIEAVTGILFLNPIPEAFLYIMDEDRLAQNLSKSQLPMDAAVAAMIIADKTCGLLGARYRTQNYRQWVYREMIVSVVKHGRTWPLTKFCLN